MLNKPCINIHVFIIIISMHQHSHHQQPHKLNNTHTNITKSKQKVKIKKKLETDLKNPFPNKYVHLFTDNIVQGSTLRTAPLPGASKLHCWACWLITCLTRQVLFFDYRLRIQWFEPELNQYIELYWGLPEFCTVDKRQLRVL